MSAFDLKEKVTTGFLKRTLTESSEDPVLWKQSRSWPCVSFGEHRTHRWTNSLKWECWGVSFALPQCACSSRLALDVQSVKWISLIDWWWLWGTLWWWLVYALGLWPKNSHLFPFLNLGIGTLVSHLHEEFMGVDLLGQRVCAFYILTDFHRGLPICTPIIDGERRCLSSHNTMCHHFFKIFVNLIAEIQYLLKVIACLFFSISEVEKLCTRLKSIIFYFL